MYLFFYPALEAEGAAETASIGVKDTQAVEAAVEAEPLLYTLMLKKLMIILRTATY